MPNPKFSAARVLARAAVAVTLCVLMVDQPLLAAGAGVATPAAPVQSAADSRVLHALNRFTFGPRPGEVAAVEAMGLKAWFESQLNPGSITDANLDARLQQFPALNLPIQELNARYPGPAMIRAMASGRVPLPSDPTAHQIAVDSIAFYKIQKAKAEAKTPDAAASADGNAMAAPAQNAQVASGRPRQQAALGMNALDEAAEEGLSPTMPPKPLTAAELNADPTQEMAAADPLGHDAALAIVAQPPDQRYQTILAMKPQDLVRFRQSLRGRELEQITAGMTPVEKETLAALPGGVRMVAAETTQARMLRDIYSNRELEAVMTDFWLNHFNVYMRKSQLEPYLIPSYERETIRPNALGNFEQLLVATAESPAMLMYLDNWQSTGPDSPQAARVQQVQKMRPNGQLAKLATSGLNENYGRELMELHTLGVGGGYTQADVTQVAKVFTGWTIDKPYQMTGGAGAGGFRFDERRHEPGAKTVLGKTIPEGGMNEGLTVLHMLASSPATAHFICSELAVRFVSDTPPPALVDRMAQSFLASHGDIKTVLRTLFDSPELWRPETARAKVKTPLEFVVSAARAGNVQVVNALGLVQSLEKLGMPLYGMQTPNGYSWKQDDWVSTGALVTRLNFALVMSGDRLPGVQTDWSGLLKAHPAGVVPAAYDAGAGGSQAGEERRLEAILVGMPVSERTRDTVLKQALDSTVAEQAATQFDLGGQRGKQASLGPKGYGQGYARQNMGGPQDDPQAAAMAGLLLGSPEFQRR